MNTPTLCLRLFGGRICKRDVIVLISVPRAELWFINRRTKSLQAILDLNILRLVLQSTFHATLNHENLTCDVTRDLLG